MKDRKFGAQICHKPNLIKMNQWASVIDSYIREEITRRIFIHGSPSFQISYVSKTLVIDKEELVLDKEIEILSPKSHDYIS